VTAFLSATDPELSALRQELMAARESLGNFSVTTNSHVQRVEPLCFFDEKECIVSKGLRQISDLVEKWRFQRVTNAGGGTTTAIER